MYNEEKKKAEGSLLHNGFDDSIGTNGSVSMTDGAILIRGGREVVLYVK